MTKYIDAEKLIAEIERQMKYYDEKEQKAWDDSEQCDEDAFWYQGHRKMCAELLSFLDSLQKEQPMPDSTKLIELWHEDKEMLKEKDFRNDPWRLAFNSFLCGFGRGIAVNKPKQPEVKDPFDDEQFRRGYEAGKHDAMREQKPKIELIQRSWYMEGYNDCKFEKEPVWIISTGPDGPQYKLNPNREGGGSK